MKRALGTGLEVAGTFSCLLVAIWYGIFHNLPPFVCIARKPCGEEFS